jgi:hypothetical protein
MDMSLHSHIILIPSHYQSLDLLFNDVCLAEKKHIPII